MDNNILDIVTSYLKGKPNETQVKEVAANEALQEEILFARQMQFTQAHKEEIQVQNILKGILAQSPNVEPDDELTEQLLQEDIIQLPKTGGSNTWIWGSSLIIGLIGILGIAFYAGLFNTYIAQYKALQTPPPAHYIAEPQTERKESIDLAVESYNQKNYEAAIAYTNDYLSTAPADNNMKMYLGVSYFHDKQYENSIEVLREVKRTPFTANHLDYYTGVALLMNNETEVAVSYLRQIPQENEHYISAKQILQKLENE